VFNTLNTLNTTRYLIKKQFWIEKFHPGTPPPELGKEVIEDGEGGRLRAGGFMCFPF